MQDDTTKSPLVSLKFNISDRFAAETAEDEVRAQLSEWSGRNAAIENLINRLRGEDPTLDKMLVGMVNW